MRSVDVLAASTCGGAGFLFIPPAPPLTLLLSRIPGGSGTEAAPPRMWREGGIMDCLRSSGVL